MASGCTREPILLKRRNGVAFPRRFRACAASTGAVKIDLEKLQRSVQGWLAHAAHGDTLALRRALLEPLSHLSLIERMAN